MKVFFKKYNSSVCCGIGSLIMRDLQELRVEIDRVDKSILELFNERMGLTDEVAQYKISVGKPVYDKEREEQKLAALSANAKTEFDKRAIHELYSQIMAISRKNQFRLLAENGVAFETGYSALPAFDFSNSTVCFQGVEGAYSQQAMNEFFDLSFKDSFHVDTWRLAMDAIKEGKADYAVLPIENSSAGSITENFDLLAEYEYTIIGEYFLKVEHALLGLKGAKIDDIKTIFSHPQAIAQCVAYIRDNHIEWNVEAMHNTAVAAMRVRDEGDKTQAAIASKLNADIYGLEVLEEQIQDNKNNVTRFVIVGKNKQYKQDAGKISLCLEIPNSTGSLYKILSHFMFNGINLTCIESRPIGNENWSYRFFIDCEGNLQDEAVKNVLVSLREECSKVVILGNY